MASHSTSQKATISSHTMAPGSATRRLRAVVVQAHQPTSAPPAISRPICAALSQGMSTRNDIQPHSVPTVPGANGERPEPKPSAMAWAGCESMKAALARRGALMAGAAAAGVAESKVIGVPARPGLWRSGWCVLR